MKNAKRKSGTANSEMITGKLLLNCPKNLRPPKQRKNQRLVDNTNIKVYGENEGVFR